MGTFKAIFRAITAMALGVFVMQSPAQSPFPAYTDLPERVSLPDPLVMLDGTRVTTAEEWRTKRRPELVELVQHYIYGFAPAVAGIEVREEFPEAVVLGGKARLKQVEIRIQGLPEDALRIHLAVIVPAKGNGPFPVFLGINSGGNHEVIADEAMRMDSVTFKEEDPTPRGARADFWCVEYQIDRGYAFATFRQSDIDPDEDDFTNGIHPFYPDLPQAPENRWGTIRAWAWGFHRCVDYLVTDKDIDAKRIAVTGHSRRGKTALLAGALDERIALVVPHQSGTGGMALSRDNDQETVERINRVFPHWFNDAFVAFGDHESKLPIDQHLVAALVAPRFLLDTEGAQDKWANPPAALRNIEAAAPVWKLLGAKSVDAPMRIEDVNSITPANVGPVQQLLLDHKHTLNRDYWVGILNYADAAYATR